METASRERRSCRGATAAIDVLVATRSQPLAYGLLAARVAARAARDGLAMRIAEEPCGRAAQFDVEGADLARPARETEVAAEDPKQTVGTPVTVRPSVS